MKKCTNAGDNIREMCWPITWSDETDDDRVHVCSPWNTCCYRPASGRSCSQLTCRLRPNENRQQSLFTCQIFFTPNGNTDGMLFLLFYKISNIASVKLMIMNLSSHCLLGLPSNPQRCMEMQSAKKCQSWKWSDNDFLRLPPQVPSFRAQDTVVALVSFSSDAKYRDY